MITYSGDVDFGVFIHDYDSRLIAEFQRAGLELMHLFGKTTDSFELSFAFGDMKLDLFFFYRQVSGVHACACMCDLCVRIASLTGAVQ